jgi:hypothetical protein
MRPPARMGRPKSRAMLRVAAAGDELGALPSLAVGDEEPDEVRDDTGLPELELVGFTDLPSAVRLPHCEVEMSSQFRFHSALWKPSPAAMTHCLNHSRHCRPGTDCWYKLISGSVPFLHLQVKERDDYEGSD